MIAAAFVMLTIPTGCRHRAAHGAATRPSSSSATTTQALSGSGTFEERAAGFRVTYPADWSPRKDPDNALTIDAVAGKADGPEISIAVPRLPPHVPGLIPLGAVEKGYLDDLRKRLRDVRTLEESNTKVNGASARRIVVTGSDDHGPRKLAVLFITRGDRLYIMTGEAPARSARAADFAKLQEAFDAVAASWAWIKIEKAERND